MRTFVLAVFALALLACGQSADNPISQTQAQEVRAPEVETPDEAAKQYEAPPVTPATPEPSKVKEAEPTQPDEPELVTTTFPPLGMHFSVPIYYGPATMERRIVDADIIAIVSLASSTTAVETHTYEGQAGYVGALKFTFTVEELIKSPAGSSPTQIVAMVGSLQAYAERSDAQAEAEKMASERDTQWDDRQAIVFLASHSLEFPGTSSDDLYFMSFVDYTYGLGDSYSIASIRNQLWLPEARTGGSDGGGAAARTPRQRRFLTGVPQQTPDTSPRAATVSTRTETPSITLTDFQTTVSRIEAELAGQSEGYRFCVQENYERLQKVALWASRGDTFMSPKTFTVEIDSGQKAGTEIIYDTLKIVLGPNGWESRTELLGTDAALFRIGETTKSVTRNYGALNSINAKKSDPELVRHAQPMETVRPLPNGFYSFTWKYHRAEYVLCAPDVFYNHTVNVNVTAPPGTLHEAFVDPVTDGSAVAADSSNGQLEPAAFTDANGASATIQRIEWASDTVKVKVSPHTGLAGHRLDFIELDGSVSLSLQIDDATVDAANKTLSWTVSEQPWEDGDKLMLRIAEVVPEVALVDVPSTVAQGSSESFTVKASGLSSADAYSIRLSTNNYAIGFDTGCGIGSKTVSVPSGSTSHSATIALHGCNVTTSTVTATLSQGTSTVDTATAEVEVEATESVTVTLSPRQEPYFTYTDMTVEWTDPSGCAGSYYVGIFNSQQTVVNNLGYHPAPATTSLSQNLGRSWDDIPNLDWFVKVRCHSSSSRMTIVGQASLQSGLPSTSESD